MAERSSLPQITITPRAAGRLRSGHVWVYESDLLNKDNAEPGALVRVADSKGKFLGSALYSGSSQISLRLLGREPLGSESDLLELLRSREQEAVAYRKGIVRNSNASRLVFSEGDRLPGLIIDRYNDVYTVQVLTQAWDVPERKAAVLHNLQELAGAENIVERVDGRIRELEQLPALSPAVVHGTKSRTVFTMNGVQFHYDALAGQKTGAF